VGFIDAKETSGDRQVIREIEVGGTDAAGKSAAQRSLQTAGAEGKDRFCVGEIKAGTNFVLASAEFAVVVGGELVVRVFAGAAFDEWSGIQADEARVGINVDARGSAKRRN
jgi:hypothetical protein